VAVGVAGQDARGRVVAPRLRRGTVWTGRNPTLRWRMLAGVTLCDVLVHQAALDAETDCALRCWAEPDAVAMEVLRHRIQARVPYGAFYAGPRPPGHCLLGLGMGRRGALWVDLDACPHLLVGGMTGGGKSVFLRQALTFLVCDQPPEQLQLALVDLKGGTELAPFSYVPHALFPVADTVLAAAQTLTAVRDELDRRLAVRRRAVEAAGEAARPPWPQILVVVDEVAELTVRDLGDDRAARAAQQAATGRLAEIARLGRSVGVHLVCCTQRPDAEAIPGQLKANLAGTVAFRVRAAVNSWILLDSDRAAFLPSRPGRGIWAEDQLEEFQAIDCALEESRQRVAARWGHRPPGATTDPVTVQFASFRWASSPWAAQRPGHAPPRKNCSDRELPTVRPCPVIWRAARRAARRMATFLVGAAGSGCECGKAGPVLGGRGGYGKVVSNSPAPTPAAGRLCRLSVRMGLLGRARKAEVMSKPHRGGYPGGRFSTGTAIRNDAVDGDRRPSHARQRTDPALTAAQPVWVVAKNAFDGASQSGNGSAGARARRGQQDQTAVRSTLREPLGC